MDLTVVWRDEEDFQAEVNMARGRKCEKDPLQGVADSQILPKLCRSGDTGT